MLDLLNLPGWPGTLLSLFAMLAYSYYVKRSAKSKAEDLAKDAYEKAIHAMQEYIAILEKRIAETEKENERLQRSIETICEALDARGLHITIQSRMVSIRDGKETTIARINGTSED
jgi:predicted RNase H-like nuclease (RuvC/YqgF family)